MVLESDELTCVHFSVTLQENLVQSCCLGCKHTDKSAFSLRHLSICWVIITNVGLMWRLSRLVRFIIGNSVALPLAPTLSFHRPHYSVNTCMCLKCEREASMHTQHASPQYTDKLTLEARRDWCKAVRKLGTVCVGLCRTRSVLRGGNPPAYRRWYIHQNCKRHSRTITLALYDFKLGSGNKYDYTVVNLLLGKCKQLVHSLTWAHFIYSQLLAN